MDLEESIAVEDEAVEIAAEPVAEEPVPPTVEELAGGMGWSDKDKWIDRGGDPDKWKPAHEFVRATVDVNHKLSNRLKGVEDQLSQVARTSAQITERAIADAREKLLAERVDAIDMGDHAKLEKVDKELGQLPTMQRNDPPETQEFMQRNDWFGKDQEATAWAKNRADVLAKEGIGTARQLAIVEREAKQYFPELFPEPKVKPKGVPLNAPGNRGAAVSRKGFSAMPADAQTAALDYEKRGICTRDEFATTFFEQDA